MTLSRREKLLLVLPLLLGALFAFYRYVHQPLFVRRAAAQELSSKAQTDLKHEQSKLVKEGDLKRRQEAVTAREQTIDAWVPGKNSAALFIWYLSEAEKASGARIRGVQVGDRKEVQAVPTSADGKAPTSSTTLAVVGLDLKVDARFAEHLLFNQNLEGMPLFLNTSALSLGKDAKNQLSFDKVGQMVLEGNTKSAIQALSASPVLTGTYHIDLYFKGSKLGPSTETMQFAETAGRSDPFVWDGVDEFLQLLINRYANPSGPFPELEDSWQPDALDLQPDQMG